MGSETSVTFVSGNSLPPLCRQAIMRNNNDLLSKTFPKEQISMQVKPNFKKSHLIRASMCALAVRLGNYSIQASSRVHWGCINMAH